MSAEACFSVTGKGSNQELVTLRGDTYAEFQFNAEAALGQGVGSVWAAEIYAHAFGSSTPSAAAVTNLQAAVGPVATVTQLHPPVQQPVAQPVAQPQPVAQTVAGQAVRSAVQTCAHGPRIFRETPGKGGTPWARFECALPWRRGEDAYNATRCKSVNV